MTTWLVHRQFLIHLHHWNQNKQEGPPSASIPIPPLMILHSTFQPSCLLGAPFIRDLRVYQLYFIDKDMFCKETYNCSVKENFARFQIAFMKVLTFELVSSSCR